MKTKTIHKRYPNCLRYYCGVEDTQLLQKVLAWNPKHTPYLGTFVWDKVTCKRCLNKRKQK